MKLVCNLIGESCGQVTCLKNATPFFGLSIVKLSRLINGHNGEAKMVHVGVATTIQNRLNIVCGPAHTQI